MLVTDTYKQLTRHINYIQFSRDQTLLVRPHMERSPSKLYKTKTAKLGYSLSFGNFRRFQQKTAKSYGRMSANYITYVVKAKRVVVSWVKVYASMHY